MRFSTHRLWDRIPGALATCGLLGVSATCAGFLGRLHWILDLFAHFRVHLALGLLPIGLFFLLRRPRRIGAVFLLFALVNVATFAHLFAPQRRIPPPKAREFRLLLLNVNTETGDPAAVERLVAGMDPDLLVLQELSARWAGTVETVRENLPHARVVLREDNFGIGLFSRYPLSEAETLYIDREAVPSLRARAQTPGGDLQLLATHPVPPVGAASTASRDEHLDALPALLDRDAAALLAGDLNTTPWHHGFRRLTRRTGLRDSMRGFGIQPTWPTTMPLLRLPLDHVLHSGHLRVTDRRIGPDVGSDHYPVIVDFAW